MREISRLRMICLWAILCIGGFGPCFATDIADGVSRQLAIARKACLSDIAYRLHFNIPVSKQEPVTGRVAVTFTLKEVGSENLVMDFQGKVSDMVTVNNYRIEANCQQEHIVIPAKMLKKGKNLVALSFVSENKSLNRNDDYLYTLFVPDHARSAFPCFDQPDLKARFSLTLQLPQGWTAISNGKASRNGTLVKFNTTELLPTYLFSFTAGRFFQRTENCNGRPVTVLYRETDPEKTAQLPTIFNQIALSLKWLEAYTGIPYPFQKYDCVILPGYQFGGMEHPGCIQFRDATLFLGKNPTPVEEMNRLNLVAHETAHSWFGDLVTMKWFDDVWTKEVYANFLADKISKEQFPNINHDLSFLKTHYTPALSTDRTAGTHPIQQPLDNLKNAGLLYGNIIYHKAPIMMRKLEERMGEQKLRIGLQQYLQTYRFDNATWDNLIEILHQQAPTAGLKAFDQEWVKGKGVAVVEMDSAVVSNDCFEYVRRLYKPEHISQLLGCWQGKTDLERLHIFMTFYENFIAKRLTVGDFSSALIRALSQEENALVAASLCDYLSVCLNYAKDSLRTNIEMSFENVIRTHPILSVQQTLLRALSRQAQSKEVLEYIYTIWDEQKCSTLNERDYMAMAYHLAIMMPEKWEEILEKQCARLSNDDRKQEFDFVSRGCNPDTTEQTRLFNALLLRENRVIEPYASSLLALLNDGTKEMASNRFITPGLEILQEIQQTGGIFFPLGWCNALLGGHRSREANRLVERFLAAHTDYPAELRSKILQATYLLSQLAE